MHSRKNGGGESAFFVAKKPWHYLPCSRQKWAQSRFARWYIFKPKIPIWINFVGPFNGKCWYILLPFALSYSHLVFFVAI
jgi:hypothetical protein